MFQKWSMICCLKNISIAIFPLYDSEVNLEFFNPQLFFSVIQTLLRPLYEWLLMPTRPGSKSRSEWWRARRTERERLRMKAYSDSLYERAEATKVCGLFFKTYFDYFFRIDHCLWTVLQDHSLQFLLLQWSWGGVSDSQPRDCRTVTVFYAV